MVEHSLIILIDLKYIVSVLLDWTMTLSPILILFVHNSMNFSICKP